MKSLLLFVTASLMLVGATIAVGIPNQVEAGWCQELFPRECFKSKADCRDSIPEGVTNNCVKEPKSKPR
jgi:hypothetical protein